MEGKTPKSTQSGESSAVEQVQSYSPGKSANLWTPSPAHKAAGRGHVSVLSVLIFFSYLRGFHIPMTQTILYTAAWLAFAKVSLRLCLRGSILGFYFGAFLALKHLFSALFPLGLVGAFVLLNPRSRAHLLKDAPEWLRD